MPALPARFFLFFIVATACSATAAQAESYVEATDAYCHKIKQCSVQQIRTNPEVTDADIRMMLTSLDEMCLNLHNRPMAPAGHPLRGLATSCMRSMANMSCWDIHNASGANPTPECARFNAAAGQ